MSESKHTPGPWRYQEHSDRYTHIVRAGDRFLCQLSQDTSGEAEANARLIAAAPDLLEALQELERWFIYDTKANKEWPPFAKARAAIAKATGAAP